MKDDKIKKLAADAKKRLTSGYWEKIMIQRNDAIAQAQAQGRDVQPIITYFREKCNRDIRVMANSVDRCEEQLYQKVKELWDKNATITNPAAIVGDMKFANRLVDSDRQRYIFRMIAKYKEMRERYDREKELLQGVTLLDFDSIELEKQAT